MDFANLMPNPVNTSISNMPNNQDFSVNSSNIGTGTSLRDLQMKESLANYNNNLNSQLTSRLGQSLYSQQPPQMNNMSTPLLRDDQLKNLEDNTNTTTNIEELAKDLNTNLNTNVIEHLEKDPEVEDDSLTLPETIREPLLILAVYVLLSHPSVKAMINNAIPQIANYASENKVNWVELIIYGVLLAALVTIFKKLLLK